MKKFIKNNILGFIIGIVLMGTITAVYAINASNITYNDTTVSQALDTLYERSANRRYETWNSGKFASTGSGIATTKTLSIDSGVKKVIIYLTVSSAYDYSDPSITGSIITSQTIQKKSSMIESGKFASAYYEIVATTDGTAGTITLNVAVDGATPGNSADAIIIYE